MCISSGNKRNIGKTLVVYLGGAWVVIEAFTFLSNRYEWPGYTIDVLMLILVFGLPATLIYTWFYRVFSRTAIILQVANIGLAVGVISYSVSSQQLIASTVKPIHISNKTIGSLAVLPIDNITGDENQEYFALGMQDAIINELGQISSLRVISRRSTMYYKEVSMTAPDIANELGVETLIEASLMSSLDSVRIQIRLIQAFPVEKNIWTHTYTRKMGNIFSLYEAIAKAITEEINITLTSQENKLLTDAKQVDPEAYRNYLKGMFHWEKLTKAELGIALEYFELAVEADPNSALGYAGTALVWGGYLQMGLHPLSDASPPMTEAYNKALKIDDSMFEVRYMMALNNWWKWNWKATEEEFKTVINLNPNFAIARAYYSYFLIIMNRPEEAMEQMEIALELDPLNPLFKALYAWNLNMMHQYSEAIKVMHELIIDFPEAPMAYSNLRTSYHCSEMYEEAYNAWKRSFKKDSLSLNALVNGYEEGGYQLALQRVAEIKIDNLEIKHSPSWQIATLYTRAGKSKEALQWLEKAYQDHDANLPSISADPIFDYLRNEPEFKNLLLKMNLPDKI
jgi:TolB-like protein